VTPAARLAQPRRWPGVVAWALWALAVVACLVVPWLDDRLRRAGRADLVQWDARPGVAAVITVTVGRCWPAAGPATRWAGCCSPRSCPCWPPGLLPST
jgi:hypothetical protein